MSIINEIYQSCFSSQCLVEKKRVCCVLGDVMLGFQHWLPFWNSLGRVGTAKKNNECKLRHKKRLMTLALLISKVQN